jgi:Spy/CpxP family protein refolding chaperone
MSKPKQRGRLQAIAVLLGIFLLGGGAGAAAQRAMMLRDLRHSMGGPPTKARARWRLEAMDRRLDLSDEQRSKLETILTESHEERHRVMGECKPAMDELRKKTDARIAEVLTAEQKKKHDAFMTKLRERRGRHGRGRGK